MKSLICYDLTSPQPIFVVTVQFANTWNRSCKRFLLNVSKINDDLVIRAGECISVATLHGKFRGRSYGFANQFQEAYINPRKFEKTGGKWQIAHEHISTPHDADSTMFVG